MWRAILLLCIAGACCIELDNSIDGATVKQVEEMLAKDANLPRLTRGEILSLIKEIRQGKDIMIVLPENEVSTTTKKPKRRRKPTRPVYKHSTTTTDNPKSTEKDNIFVTVDTTNKTTTTTESNVAIAAESLGDDMKLVLNSIGLLGSTTTEKNSFQGSLTPTVDPSSFARFKPLPAPKGVSTDMESFLASYGLLDQRKGKAVQSDPLEQLPHGKEVLKEMGLLKDKKNHVFNPSSVNSTKELGKVNKILMKLREFSEGNATSMNNEEVTDLLQLENLEHESEINLENNSDSIRNEIKYKRQEPNSTDSLTDTTTIASDTTDEPSTDSGASAVDLEESFGAELSTTTTKKPNGFYFLLDWNSFVDVGLEERQVNVNFSPKVGDPSLFIPVKIP